jgi:hypothetical protein
MCYKYVGSITVLPAEIGYDRLTYLRQWYDTPGTLGDVGRNSYWNPEGPIVSKFTVIYTRVII